MKKLMILAAVVCAAVASQAAAFDWKTSATGKIYEAGSTTLIATGTAYIFDSAALTQAAVLANFAAGNTSFTSSALDSKTVTSGAIAAAATAPIDWGAAGDVLSAYMVLLSDDSILISDIATGAGQTSSKTTLSFNMKTASQAAAFTDTSSFQGAGWYTAAVPEPTSGLLLLLGMAGLALKRKQA